MLSLVVRMANMMTGTSSQASSGTQGISSLLQAYALVAVNFFISSGWADSITSQLLSVCDPLPSDRQHLSYDVCLEVGGEIIRTVLCCIVYWSCAQSEAHCVDLFVFVFFCVFVLHCIVVVSLWARWGGPDGIEAWSFGPIFLQCFDAVGWVIWPVKIHPRYDL